MQTILHKNDLSNGINFSNIIAADCEMMGLQPNRDPLCLIQLYDGKGDCHLVQFIDQNFDAPNLKKLLGSDKTFIFHYARHDLAAIKHDLNIMIKNVYCTKISSKIARTYSQGHGYKDLCKEKNKLELINIGNTSNSFPFVYKKSRSFVPPAFLLSSFRISSIETPPLFTI